MSADSTPPDAPAGAGGDTPDEPGVAHAAPRSLTLGLDVGSTTVKLVLLPESCAVPAPACLLYTSDAADDL